MLDPSDSCGQRVVEYDCPSSLMVLKFHTDYLQSH
jgi:hypothetical protein